MSRAVARSPRDHSPVTLIAARTLVAGLLLLGIARWRGLHLPRDGGAWTAFLLQAIAPSRASLLALLALAVFSTALALAVNLYVHWDTEQKAATGA
ncbi:hypothetical protein [Paracidovorax oryzae]|uniref:hypothetical protein n=1 Tax=Paracidovorax oryzae TaxID=862720 RepID=UPI000373A2CA|nr:hypothetical protein [Paracidovorax oryzae]